MALLLGGCGSTNRAPVLVYAKVRYVQSGGVGLVEERGTIWVAKIDGSRARRRVAGLYPDVSPDGRWVAFHREDGLYLIETEGGRVRLVARDPLSLDWSPDSRRLAVSAQGSLWILDVETGERVEIARGDGLYGLSFSPSGEEIAWVREEGRPPRITADLYKAPAGGGEPQRLTRSGDATQPVWGPQLIAFGRFEDDPLLPAHPFYELWAIRPDGSAIRRLGRDRVILPFEWSRDGHRLLATWATVASSAPIAVDPVTGKERLIGRFGGEAYTAAFSRDGRFVLAWDQGDLVRIPWASTRKQILVRDVDEVADWSL